MQPVLYFIQIWGDLSKCIFFRNVHKYRIRLNNCFKGNRNDYLTESMKVLLGVENMTFLLTTMLPLFTYLSMPSKKHSKETVIVSRGEIIEIGGFLQASRYNI